MTKTVLHLDSSARYQGSVSRELSKKTVEQLGADEVIYRDLAHGVDLIDQTWVFANFTAPDERSDAQKERLALSDTLIAELKKADTVVIGVPLYNFGVPAAFKLWIDQVARAGVTFQYTENGPKGLLEGKKAIVVMTSAGVPSGSPADFLTPYVKFVLGFIGIQDVEFVNADRNLERAETVISDGEAQIEELVA